MDYGCNACLGVLIIVRAYWGIAFMVKLKRSGFSAWVTEWDLSRVYCDFGRRSAIGLSGRWNTIWGLAISHVLCFRLCCGQTCMLGLGHMFRGMLQGML